LLFYAVESLSILHRILFKAEFPDDYQEKINVGKALIVRLKKIYNKESYQEAYQRYINSGCRKESGIMLICALQQLIDEEKAAKINYENTIAGIIDLQEQYLRQQEANEHNITIDEVDKKLLRQFYRAKLDELNHKLTEMANEIEVNDVIIVTAPTLFTDYASA